MADHTRVALWSIGVTGDDADITTFLSSLKGKFQATVNDLERASAQANLFSGLQDSVKAASDALAKAKQDVTNFTGALAAAKDAGKDVTTDLQAKLTAAQAVVKSTTTEFNKQVDAISRVQGQLARAGIDTSNLASAQIKLAAATAAATDALALQQAKQTLGLKTVADTIPQINALNAAFATFKASGASVSEVTQAERALEQQTGALLAGVTQLPGTLEKAGRAGVSAFNTMGGGALLALLGIGSVAAGIKTAITASIDFTTELGKIGAVTTLSDAQLNQLGESARALARTLGIDVNDALKALYQIVRSANLGPEDSLEVLKVSAEAAKASFTDLNVVTKISTVLIGAYRLPVDQVAGALNQLFTSAQHGGPALGELGDGFGKLLLVAKDSNIPLNVVIAALDSMSSATGDAGGAVGDLQKLILKFETAPVQAKLKAAGISATDFKGVMDELAAKGLHLEDFVQLGLASAKTGIALDALTQGSKPLSAALVEVASNANATADALARVEKTPKDNIDRLTASFKDIAISVGNSAPVTAFADGVQAIGDRAAETTKSNRELYATIARIGAGLDASLSPQERYDAALHIYSESIANATNETDQFHASEAKSFSGTLAADLKSASDAAQKLSADIKKATQELGDAQDILVADAGKLQTAADLALAASKKSTDEQIAGLDRLESSVSGKAAALKQVQTDIVELSATQIKSMTDVAAKSQEGLDQLDKDAIKFADETGASLVEAYAKVGQVIELTNESIAGSDAKSVVSAVSTAAALLQIQTDGVADRLSIIERTEAAVSVVLDEAIGKREKALADEVANGKKTYAQGQAELAQIRLDAINKTLKDYQGEYDDLAKQQQKYNADANAAAIGKLEFDKGVEKTLFDLRIQNLGKFQASINTANAAQSENLDQYVARVNEANRLIAKAQAEAEAGFFKASEEDAKQAITIANQLKTVVSANGAVLISSFDLVQTKTKLVKDAADLVDKSFEEQGSAAEKGANESKLWLGIVLGRILDLQLAADTLKLTVAQGLKYSISIDQATYQIALDKLANLKDKTITVRILTVDAGGNPIALPPGVAPAVPVTEPSPGFERGGHVMKAIQSFAAGGPIFRAPSWSKVPGSGNGDTVPAALPVGAFVMRKMASQYYGDGIMGQLVRGFATGGWVPPGGPASPWGAHQNTAAEAQSLHDLKVQADVEVYAMLSRAVNLPRATFGQDVRDYISRVRELISADSDITDATSLLDKLVTFYARFYPAIEISKQMHVPLVMGIQVAADPNPTTKAKPASGGTDGGTPLLSPGNPFGTWAGFASGGHVDSIPAMLTPGEHVLNPPAVQFAQRMFGGGFLDALNGMQVSRGFLDNMMNVAPPQPRRFANGGYVDGPGAPMPTSGASVKGPLPSITINVQHLTEDELNRTVRPWLIKLQTQ